MIEFHRILGDAPPAFAGMTFSSHAALLRGLTPQGEVIALAPVADGTPIGLALARIDADGIGAEVLSLFVQPTLWRQGIGTALLEAVEQVMRERRCREARIAYSTGPSSAALERVLQKRGWSPPQPRMLLAQIGPELMHDRWVAESRIPSPFEVFAWSELTATERAALEAVRSTIPPPLWPFESDAPVEPCNSLGLRLAGEVVGWMVTHRVAPQVVRFTALYIREPWRRTELSFALLAEALRRKARALPPEVVSSMAVQVENQPMLRVAERRLRRHARLWEERRVSSKALA